MIGPDSLQTLSISSLCEDLRNPNYFMRDLGTINSRKYRNFIHENYGYRDFLRPFSLNFPAFCEEILHHIHSHISPLGKNKLTKRFEAICNVLDSAGLTHLKSDTIEKVRTHVILHFQLFLGIERCLRNRDGLPPWFRENTLTDEDCRAITHHVHTISDDSMRDQSFESLLSGNLSNLKLKEWVFNFAPNLRFKYDEGLQGVLGLAKFFPEIICYKNFKFLRRDDEFMMQVVRTDGRYWPMCSAKVQKKLDLIKEVQQRLDLDETSFWQEMRLREKGKGIFANVQEIDEDFPLFEKIIDHPELKAMVDEVSSNHPKDGTDSDLITKLFKAMYKVERCVATSGKLGIFHYISQLFLR